MRVVGTLYHGYQVGRAKLRHVMGSKQMQHPVVAQCRRAMCDSRSESVTNPTLNLCWHTTFMPGVLVDLSVPCPRCRQTACLLHHCGICLVSIQYGAFSLIDIRTHIMLGGAHTDFLESQPTGETITTLLGTPTTPPTCQISAACRVRVWAG